MLHLSFKIHYIDSRYSYLLFIASKSCANVERARDVPSLYSKSLEASLWLLVVRQVREWDAGLRCGGAFMRAWMNCPKLWAYGGNRIQAMHYARTRRFQTLMAFLCLPCIRNTKDIISLFNFHQLVIYLFYTWHQT